MSSSRKAPWLHLNPAQSEAVHRTEGPVLILAGAGTGKTRVVTTRIAYLVHRGIDAGSILAVTFTNKAANEMRERAGKMIDRADAKRLIICTFHSLCVRILRQSIDRLGYKRNFTIYTANDQKGLVRRIIARKAAKDERMEPGVALALISRAKNAGLPVFPDAGALIAEVYRAYCEELKNFNAVDFDDLLVLAVRALEEHPDVRRTWRERFDYVMVDEFQDTNSLQMRLLQQLINERRNVCVVGDDDQSIYGWRGAEVSNILEFERYFPNPAVVKLEENYRSTLPILETANGLIRNNLTRREKSLWTKNGGDGKVRLSGMPDEKNEAEFVVNEIWEGKHVHGRAWEDYAVLFRMNLQSRAFEQALREKKIPYRVVGGQSFFDRREVKDLLAYLTVFCNPHDDINFLRIVNTPPRGIGKGVVAPALERSNASDTSVYATLKDPAFTGTLGARARNAVDSFIKFIDCYGQACIPKNADYAALAERMMEAVDYPAFVYRLCRTEEEKEARAQAMAEFLQGLRDHRAKSGEGLQAYLDDVALMADRDSEDDIESKKGVCLITLHAAKGLEFPTVYLVGLEEGILPHKRSLGEGVRDEERRLLYVGITRAMRELTLTYCLSRVRYGDPVPTQPSSFIRELSPEHVEELDYDEVMNRPATEEEAERSFASLRAMLEGIEGHSLED